jgi:hypothetical protein
MSTKKELKDLVKAISKWAEEGIPPARLGNDASTPRPWYCKTNEYEKSFKLEDLKTETDREELNNKYVERFHEIDPKSRKGISALKSEISALYSYQKCFTQRYKGRMHFYRDDLSQKGKRTGHAYGRGAKRFEGFKSQLDS